MLEEEKENTQIYHNCKYRNRNGTNKLIQPGKICIFEGRNQLHYRNIKQKYSMETNTDKKHCKIPPRHRNHIVMMKLTLPRKVTVLNVRTFYARYKRVKGFVTCQCKHYAYI